MSRSPPGELPPLPKVPKFPRWHWITDTAELIYSALQLLVERTSDLMAKIADLTAAVAAQQAQLVTLEGDIQNLISVFNSVKGGLSAADQSALDLAIQQIQATTATMAVEEANIDAANPDPVPPPPAP